MIVNLAGGSGGSGGSATTQTTTKKVVRKASGIGVRTVTWTDTTSAAGLAVSPESGGSAKPRTLLTEIWYPSTSRSKTTATNNASPDYSAGPYPVIVFAHSFDTVPSTYSALIYSWVKAGFVVVAPLFPDENANEIASLGTATLDELEIAESDVVSEPYDIAYVLNKVEAGAAGEASSGASWLKGLAEEGKVALAGHSDGADSVAALVYSSKYGSAYDTLAARPFAVVILSGAELSGTYAAPTSAPSALIVQSAADYCNLPQEAVTLLHGIGGAYFLKLDLANHFSPFIGKGVAARVVESVTISLLKASLAGTLTMAKLPRLASWASVATLYPPTSSPVLASLAKNASACTVP